MRLLGLCGTAGVGKDTVAEYLAANYDFKTYALADPIKRAAHAMLWIPVSNFYDRELKEVEDAFWKISPRRICQLLGTEFGRAMIDPEVWIKRAQVEWDRLRGEQDDTVTGLLGGLISGLVVTDIRYDNEAQWVLDQGGELWRVIRPSLTSEVDFHSSEDGVSAGLETTAIVNNDGIVHLYHRVDLLMGKR